MEALSSDQEKRKRRKIYYALEKIQQDYIFINIQTTKKY